MSYKSLNDKTRDKFGSPLEHPTTSPGTRGTGGRPGSSGRGYQSPQPDCEGSPPGRARSNNRPPTPTKPGGAWRQDRGDREDETHYGSGKGSDTLEDAEEDNGPRSEEMSQKHDTHSEESSNVNRELQQINKILVVIQEDVGKMVLNDEKTEDHGKSALTALQKSYEVTNLQTIEKIDNKLEKLDKVSQEIPKICAKRDRDILEKAQQSISTEVQQSENSIIDKFADMGTNLNADISDIKSDLQNASTETASIKSNIKYVKSSLSGIEKTVKSLDENQGNLQRSLNDMSVSKGDATKEILLNQDKMKKEIMENQNREMSKLKSEFKKMIDNSKEIQLIQNEMDGLSKNNQQIQNELSISRRNEDQMQAKLNMQENELTANKSEIRSLRKDVKEQQDISKHYEKKLNETEDELNRANNYILDLKRKIEKSNKNLSDGEKRETVLKQHIDSNNREIQGIRRQFSDKERENMQMNKEIQRKERENATLKRENEDKDRMIRDLQSDHEAMREEIIKLSAPPLSFIVPMPIFMDERLRAIVMGVQEQSQKQKITFTFFPKVPANIQKEELVILPSIIASRVGSDIQVTFNSAEMKSTNKAILLVFNHLAPHNAKISTPTKDRLNDPQIAARCHAIIDFVFWQGKVYDCPVNHDAVQEVRKVARKLLG